jgi:2-polyprenyl-3-methyl-5-hydroxy-6-metoxy-1,4-benzoquinol methylase
MLGEAHRRGGGAMTDRLKALADSWDANADNWTRAVRERRIASRTVGADAAIVEAVVGRGPRRLLDAGCGEGWLVRTVAGATACTGVGIDAAAALIEAARAADPSGDYRVLGYGDLVAGRHDLGPGFDVVAFNYALFDADQCVAALLSAASGLLGPGGAVVIQTLHPDALGPGVTGWQVEDFAAFEGGAGWAAMPWYARSRAGWDAVVEATGLTVVETREPAALSGGPPLSLLLICESVDGPTG